MPTTWNQINLKLNNIKQEVISQSKRVIKTQVPKSESVRREICDNLVKLFNEFTNILKKYWNSLEEAQKSISRQIFLHIRDRVVRAFLIIEVNFKIPLSCTEQIDPSVIDEDLVADVKVVKIDEDESGKMPLSAVDFFNFASKIVPNDFDGTSEKLRSFLDALDLLKNNSEGHQQNAIAFIKTRLSGKARDLITNENSIEEITACLKNGIKGENSVTPLISIQPKRS